MDAHEIGFRIAAAEIFAGIASRVEAKERGLFPGDQESRIEWDCGYADALCAYRLGHSVQEMAASGLFFPSLLSTHAVVSALLDGTWPLPVRPDPRGP